MLTGAQWKMELIATVTLGMVIIATALLKVINAHANQTTGTVKAKLGTYAMTITGTTALEHTSMERPTGAWMNPVYSGT